MIDNDTIQLTDCAMELANMRADRDAWKRHAEDLQSRLNEKIESLIKATDTISDYQTLFGDFILLEPAQ